MKKMFVAPELQVIALCEKDILTLSTVESKDAMVQDLKDLLS